jgi:hypothetical protein
VKLGSAAVAYPAEDIKAHQFVSPGCDLFVIRFVVHRMLAIVAAITLLASTTLLGLEDERRQL